MNDYRHTQRGTLILGVMLGISLVLILVGSLTDPRAFLIAPILLLSAWLFHSLTIEIAEGELRWRFGPGLIRKRVALGDIASARIVRTKFLEGWGIHFSRFGWLHNVSGYNAVAITLRNGKRFCLGTDDSETLAARLVGEACQAGVESPRQGL